MIKQVRKRDEMKPLVAVLILGYNAKKNIDDCFPNLLTQDYENYKVWFADNNSRDGAVEYIEEKYPKVRVLKFKENFGYAGGNNRLMRRAFGKGVDFCLILNSDIKVNKDLISNLIETFETKSKAGVKIGLIQPVIMLFNKPELINSAGNVIHYLGYGYCGSYLSSVIPKVDQEIISVSGTVMLISKNYFDDVGRFDDDFFMYNEDQNYSWRGLMKGYRHFLSTKGMIWHKYGFAKNKIIWYHSEKNRLKMVLENYESKTLWLLSPLILVNEILLTVYSMIDGWLLAKIKSYGYLFRNLELIRSKRKAVQQTRVVRDKDLITKFSYKLSFAERDNMVIRKIINPIYRIYNSVLIRLL